MTVAAFLWLVLEFLKAISTFPVVIVVVALLFRPEIKEFLGRVVSAKVGPTEFTAPHQSTQNALVAPADNAEILVPLEGVAITGSITQVLPAVSSQGIAHVEVPSDCEERLKAAETNSTLWEYKFFNLLLVAKTQFVLDWIARRPTRVTIQLLDNVLSTWGLPLDERKATYSVLEDYHLVRLDGALVTLTDKAHDYMAWEGRNRAHQASPPATPPASQAPPMPATSTGPQ